MSAQGVISAACDPFAAQLTGDQLFDNITVSTGLLLNGVPMCALNNLLPLSACACAKSPGTRDEVMRCLALYCTFSLLTLWTEGQFTNFLRQCPQERLRIFSPVPRCGSLGTIACDPFLYSAAQLAEDDLNINSSLLDNVTVQVNPADEDVSIDEPVVQE